MNTAIRHQRRPWSVERSSLLALCSLLHVSRFTFHGSRFTVHALRILLSVFVIGAAHSAFADLPDLGFGSVALVTTGEEIDKTREGAQVVETFGKEISGLVAGQYDTIQVALNNFGASEVQHAVVRFYEEGAPEEDRSPIGADVTVERIAPGETATLQKVWDTLGRAGTNRIFIQIDPDGQVVESDEENNGLSFERTVHLLGDFNQDGRIDPLDRTILERALGSRPGDINWNPVCDIWKSGLDLPGPPNIRPWPDGMADHADHVVFDRLMDLDLKSVLARIAFDHSDHVVFDPGSFHVGDEIRITVRFPTVGSAEVGKLAVKFYDGSPDEGGTFIGESLVSGAFGGIGKADVLWRTDEVRVGVHRIFAVADPDNRKVESFETNNVLSTTIELASTDVTDPDTPLPGKFFLMQNVPNPFNGGTVIPFEVVEMTLLDNAEIQVAIYDVLGREVYLQTAYPIQGQGRIVWDGRDHSGRTVSSGVYFYRLMINGKAIGATRSMVILR